MATNTQVRRAMAILTILLLSPIAQATPPENPEPHVTRVYDICDILKLAALADGSHNASPPAAITLFTPDNGTTPESPGTAVPGLTPAKQNHPTEPTKKSLFSETGTTSNCRQQDTVIEIIDVIQTTVAHDTWNRAGGTIGSIREHNGHLFVTQTQKNQTAVDNLLQQLRETQLLSEKLSTTIPIEARVWLATEEACEKIAKALNQKQISDAILDDTMNANLQQAFKETQATLIAEKKITVRSGETFHWPFTSRIIYVSGYTAVDTPGKATEYVPNYSIVHPGLFISIDQTVSADKRYVVSKARFTPWKLTGMKASLAPNTPPEKKLMVETPEWAPDPLVTGVTGFNALPKIRFDIMETMVSIPENATAVFTGPMVTHHFLLRGFTEAAHDKEQPKYRVLLTYTPRIVHPVIENQPSKPQP